MKELNDEVLDDMHIDLNITWKDILLLVLAVIGDIITAPFHRIRAELQVNSQQEETDDSETAAAS